jgi:methylisocitrate lyase
MRRATADSWQYRETWTPLPSPTGSPAGVWLVPFCAGDPDAAATADALADAFTAAGADAVFVEGAGTPDLARVVEGVTRATGACPPLVVNRSEAAGDEPPLDQDALRELGVRVVIHPVSALLAAAHAQASVYAAIAATGDAGGAAERLGWTDLTDLVGLPDLLTLEQRYAAGDTA